METFFNCGHLSLVPIFTIREYSLTPCVTAMIMKVIILTVTIMTVMIIKVMIMTAMIMMATISVSYVECQKDACADYLLSVFECFL